MQGAGSARSLLACLLAGAVEGLSADGAKLVARVVDLTFGEPEGECDAGERADEKIRAGVEQLASHDSSIALATTPAALAKATGRHDLDDMLPRFRPSNARGFIYLKGVGDIPSAMCVFFRWGALIDDQKPCRCGRSDDRPCGLRRRPGSGASSPQPSASSDPSTGAIS